MYQMQNYSFVIHFLQANNFTLRKKINISEPDIISFVAEFV